MGFKTLTTFIALTFFGQISFGQTFDQLGSPFSGTMLTSDPVEIFYDSQNNPIVAKMQNGNLHVEKFDGTSWGPIDATIPIVAFGIDDFELDFTTSTNTIIVVYVDGSSIFVREYDNGWNEPIEIDTYSSSSDDQCAVAINPQDQIAYIAYNSGGPSTWLEFDYVNETFTPMPTDPMLTNGIYFDESDLSFNEKDGLMYLIYENYGLNVGVATYDGTAWNNLMTTVMGMGFTTTASKISACFDTTGTNDLLIHTVTYPNNEVGIVKYTQPGQVMTSPEPWYTPPSSGGLYGCDMTVRHTNTQPTYAFSSYPGSDMVMTIKYWDGASWVSVNNSLLNYRLMDITYDLNDDLLITAIFENDIKLYVFRVNIHTIGVSELTSTEVQIAPNPATESIAVTTNEACNVSVISIDGNTVASTSEFNTNHQIDIQQLNSGLYFVRTITKNGTVSSSKFTKL